MEGLLGRGVAGEGATSSPRSLSIRRPIFRLTFKALISGTPQSGQPSPLPNLFARLQALQLSGASRPTTPKMAPIDRCLASMARLTVTQGARPAVPTIPRYLAPALVHSRQASVVRINKKAATKKKTLPKDFKRHNLDKREFPRFSLSEAMR